MARSQHALREFWTEYRKIPLPPDGKITEIELVKLKELMAIFKIKF